MPDTVASTFGEATLMSITHLGTLSFFLLAVALAGAGCSSEDAADSSDDGSVREYAPCDGEASLCALATRFGGSSGDGCLCTHFCEVTEDCPVPSTGNAVPLCVPYGDFEVDGHTAECTLPCDAETTCPDGMFCSGAGCIGVVSE